MKITIINNERNEKRYTRVELETFVAQLRDGAYRHYYVRDYNKEVCFAAEWFKQNGELKPKSLNGLVLLSLENLRDLATVQEYKRLAIQQPYTLLCFLGHDGHSLRIVCPYAVAAGGPSDTTLRNAFRKLHYIYSSQLCTPLAETEPTFGTCCMTSYDPQPFYNPSAIAITVSAEPEDSPEFRPMQEAILADGCRQMGLPQAWCVRACTFIPLLGEGVKDTELFETVFKTAYLRETLKTIPLKFTRPSAVLAYKTEAYMKEHYTLRLNVMTGTPEYRLNAVGYGFQPLDQAARNTMAIKALKAGVESWDKDLNRYIDSNLIPRYYPMEDYLKHLPKWNGKTDYVGELARRVKTDNPYWESDFHTWMLSMVAQWLGKDRQHGNAIVPLLIGPQGSGKTTFCKRLLPGYLQVYFNDRLSMKSDNDIFIAMSSYALINIDEFDAMSKSQQPILKYLLSKHDVKFRPPYGKTMEERQRFASFIATTNNRRPLIDATGSRRFICVYAEEIDNDGIILYDKLYAQLYAELEQGRRYWFEDEDNARIIEQNEPFQQVSSYEQMIALTYLSPEETSDDAAFVPVQLIMKRLEKMFPTFTIRKGTDSELGKRLTKMGYERKRNTKGSAFKVEAI